MEIKLDDDVVFVFKHIAIALARMEVPDLSGFSILVIVNAFLKTYQKGIIDPDILTFLCTLVEVGSLGRVTLKSCKPFSVSESTPIDGSVTYLLLDDGIRTQKVILKPHWDYVVFVD